MGWGGGTWLVLGSVGVGGREEELGVVGRGRRDLKPLRSRPGWAFVRLVGEERLLQVQSEAGVLRLQRIISLVYTTEFQEIETFVSNLRLLHSFDLYYTDE